MAKSNTGSAAAAAGKRNSARRAFAYGKVTKKPAAGSKRTQKAKKDNIRIAFLGGMNEIGKNITVLEYGNDMLVIDCGLGFPDDDMFGVDLVIPDVSYLVKNQHKLRAIALTHGHEDHIGALPYVLREVNLSRKKPLGPWFYPTAKYLFCGVTLAVLVLGAVCGSIG